MSRSNRKHERFVRRLETEFTAENMNYRGISSDVSCNGLFIRTNHAFAPGSVLDIIIHLPDGMASKLRGRVKRSIKTPIVSLKNGMGVELIEKDPPFALFMKSFTSECDGDQPSPTSERETGDSGPQTGQLGPDDFLIIACPDCGVRNKIRRSKMSMGPRCGKCRAPITGTA